MKPTKPTTLSDSWDFNLETAEFSSPPKDSEPNQILVFADMLADGAISATITPITGQPDHNLGHDWRECCFLFRYKDQEHSYLAGIGGFGKEFFIAKVSGSEWQLLAGAGQAADLKFHSSYRLKLECAGHRLRLFHSDVLILNAVDSGYSSGRCGLRVNRKHRS
jgi:hypothetical protein